MLKKFAWLTAALFITVNTVQAVETVVNTTEKKEILPKEPLKEEQSETLHTTHINGQEVQYKAIAGNLLLRNEQDNPKASIFYVAYLKEGVTDNASRPIIFCFNGGPGSSSVWLHMGILGPKRVLLNDKGESLPPYQYVDNEYSLLDVADLVFIDPVSTGYSRAAPGEEAKQFHGVDQDIASVGEFIRQFITRYEKWDSPKLLAGESYGTTRAAGLAEYMHDKMNIYLNGVALISSVLNFQTISYDEKGNDLPYPLFLPTYAATAFYHKRLTDDLQKDLPSTLEKVKQFATTEYTVALMKGNTLSEDERNQIIQKLSLYTSISPDFIRKSDLRLSPGRFTCELLQSSNECVGRFDSRIIGDKLDPSCNYAMYDPSFDAIAGAYTAAFNQYVRKDLQVKEDREYKIVARINQDWNFDSAKNQYLDVSSNLHDVMTQNKNLKVFIANGYYDLATPFFATEYTVNHLRLVPSLQKQISMYYYDAGHVMYTHKPSLIKLKQDLSDWIKKL